MRVKTNRRMMSLIVLTAVMLCGLVAVGSQVKVFGLAISKSRRDARRQQIASKPAAE